MALRTPPPTKVSSQTGPELNMQITASASRAAAAASHACAIPKAESASALAAVRFQTARPCPAWAMRRAMWAPMMPVPRKPTDSRRVASLSPAVAEGSAMMTACGAHGALLHYQCGEALSKPGQMRRLQMGIERRPAVIHLIEEDVVGRPLHLDNVELPAARLVGNGMARIVLRQGQEGVDAVRLDDEFRDHHEGGRVSGLGHGADPPLLTPPWPSGALRSAPSRVAHRPRRGRGPVRRHRTRPQYPSPRAASA